MEIDKPLQIIDYFILNSSNKDYEQSLNLRAGTIELINQIECLHLVNDSSEIKERKGSSVESRVFIPAHQNILIYFGEIISTTEARRRHKEVYDPNFLNYVLTIKEHLKRPIINISSSENDNATATNEFEINSSQSQLLQEDIVLISNFDATFFGGLARFVNHSCSPNCEVVLLRSSPQDLIGVPVIKSLIDISPGQEITIDYGFSQLDDSKPSNEPSEPNNNDQTTHEDSSTVALNSHNNTLQPMDIDRSANMLSYELYCSETIDDSGSSPRRNKNKKGKRKKCLCHSKNCKGYLPYDGTL